MEISNKDISGIDGVEFALLEDHIDDRGQFTEWFMSSWFSHVNWDRVQSNVSKSETNVLRGMHYHFYQYDYWYVPQGTILVGLYDFRQNSPTKGNKWSGFMSGDTPLGLLIPPGVVHGFYCVDTAVLFYVVNNYYDGSDEFGINWKDPVFEDLFQIENPTVSSQDESALLIKERVGKRLNGVVINE